MADRYRVRVYNSMIHGLFTPGGQVTDEAKSITRKTEARAVAKALRFARTGEIARSHRRLVVPSGPRYGTRGYVYNTADHALLKHRGVTEGTVITSRRPVDRRGAVPGKLRLRPGNGRGYLYRAKVSGYHPGSAEPWLLDAANEVLLRYGTRAFDEGNA